MDTLTETMERILEIAIITDHIHEAEASGELTPEQAREIVNHILKG